MIKDFANLKSLKTGEIVLSKADVGLSNVDNTSDIDKPVSTATATILDNKMNRRIATIDELNGVTLRAGSYYVASERTILGTTAKHWNVIVGESSGEKKSQSQIWIPVSSGINPHIFVRKQETLDGVTNWGDFFELANSRQIDDLQTKVVEAKTDITKNATDITNLQIDRAERRQASLEELNSTKLRAGLYNYNEASHTILGETSRHWNVIVGEYGEGNDAVSVTQIWMPYVYGANTIPRMFIRRANGDQSWTNFVELISTNHISNAQLQLAKHYKGYFDTVDNLVSSGDGANGDYAIVGSENVIYIWNKTQNAWASIVNSASVGNGVVTSVNGMIGDVTLTKTNVGLGHVNNTSDADKPVSTAQQTALNNKVRPLN